MSRGVLLPLLSPPAAEAPGGQQLLAEFIRYGRQKPFEEIVRRYAGMVFNVCLRITKDKHEAEDATQAVFLTLAVQAKRGAEIKALGPWLQQVAKRLSLDVRRGQKRRKTREERHHHEQEQRRAAVDGDALPSPDLDELKTILHEELQKLPAKYRLPLILHYFGGMTRDEMAAELNCKPSTLGVRIFRGREMLAGRLTGRGVHITAGAMAVALGYLVKRTVSDAMVARTTHAAVALASGADLTTVGQLMAAHDGSAVAAARVVGLARRASHALVIGKVRVTVSVALLAGTSLGAGVKALAMLPPIGMGDVQQFITAGVNRLVRPLVPTLSLPLRADATGPVAAPAVAVARPAAGWAVLPFTPWPTQPSGIAPVATGAVGMGAIPGVIPVAGPAVAPARVGWTGGAALSAPPQPVANDRLTVAAGDGGGAAGGAESAAARKGGDPTLARATALPLITASGDGEPAGGGGTSAATAANDLYVPAAGGESLVLGGTALAAASQVQIVQVPAVGGSVTESNGVVRGYGKVARTGTLGVSGKVVADGQGVDRTLDLTGFSAVSVAPPSSTGGATGWYAANHGRLSLPLIAGPASAAPVAGASLAVAAAPAAYAAAAGAAGLSVASTSPAAVAAAALPPSPPAAVLTWGSDPTAPLLTPVNSVRLTIFGNGSAAPAVPSALSLLAPDRSDAPALPVADGAPVGLWEIEPATAPLSSVELDIRYDDHLVDELGGSESAVRLWTLGDAGDGWQPVDDASFSVDVADHLVSGVASDVSYFAVTVPPAAGVEVGDLIAHPASEVAGASEVPEPTTAGMIAAAGVAGLLGRRRLASVQAAAAKRGGIPMPV